MTIRVACLGDSITRAQFSADYLDLLSRRFGPGEATLSRFGVNGDLAYNLLQRLDQVLAAPFDVITVLIGTNDARASLATHPVDKVMKRKHLPTRPSAAWFQDSLSAVVERLRAETDATVGLLSLPVLGQDLAAAPAQASEAYSRMIAEVAAAGDLPYLALHERQAAELRRLAAPPVSYREATPAWIVSTAAERILLRRSHDVIARRRGLVLTTDHVHQNSRGAALIAEVIEASGLLRGPERRSGEAIDLPHQRPPEK